MRKLLCTIGVHKYIWQSEYDKNLYWQRRNNSHNKLVTGPLLECQFCNAHKRCENFNGEKILLLKQ